MTKKADVMLHPVRMRLIQTLLSYNAMTVQQLLEKLDDIPQATMYRHLKHLVDADLIEVINTKKIRGAIEKTYAIKKENLTISEEEVADTPVEEHLRYFMTYQANLLKEFENYVLKHSAKDFAKDGLGFSQTTLHLTADEMAQFGRELGEVIQRFAQNEPKPERQARTLATIFIPQK
ncbi:helix-turn-helix domain-containing protein [Halalkalibacter nanhaiisediminis]|uniref:Helix-turn-helix protein n=1 Tax=Halalkalibacter nanhaiisediminis TaxID=688079 RepID=A0A562QIL2_9BACI|nr:helix-turn-helix domain-containing protein [Halalkalibacter nanhaiisediminis]TWI56020.1 helix-turn-helix protein [Halalkalibacter nanhaiisediminis]